MEKFKLSQLNNKGMYLIEIIFIILIISTFFLLTPIINKNVCDSKIKFFINSLNIDINYGLEYSITNFTLVKIRFYPTDNLYKISDGNSNNLKEYKYDKSLKLDSYIIYNTIEISHGNVNSYYYFYLSCGNLKYKINIYEKSGIINVSK